MPTGRSACRSPTPIAKEQIDALERNCKEFGIRLEDRFSPLQGIVHVIGPELGLTQPGMTIVCGDSHTSTHGAFGALAFGIGTSEVEHVLATQTLLQRKPKTMEVRVDGELPLGVTRQGHHPGHHRPDRHRRGDRLRHRVHGQRHPRPVDGRPHDGVQHVDRRRRPRRHDRARRHDVRLPRGPAARAAGRGLGTRGRRWRELPTDPGATYDKSSSSTPAQLEPHVTWGTNPGMVAPVTGRVPDPAASRSATTIAARSSRRCGTWTCSRGTPIRDIELDRVFIGSCTNARIEDLRAAARVVQGKQVHPRVRAMVVPGLAAGQGRGRAGRPRPGLHARRLRVARGGLQHVPGHEPGHPAAWRALRQHLEPQLRGPPGQGRPHPPGQPAMAAAAAIAGHFVDIREWND